MRLGGGELIPRQVALQGLRFRVIPSEEEFAGETVSEKDVAIEHTKSEDVVWFYGTLVGAPKLTTPETVIVGKEFKPEPVFKPREVGSKPASSGVNVCSKRL